ncbi:carbohydrate kinase family protein [Aeoliella sp. ICT_H6.2]|uniref:Carbohydrate kinase family protein n=1 Tax=Aeoliella straminimaris TaxID=2954799 RepID=A0A9X2FIW4_9BACT|nr:carbohydrate kinase family protein [Aeoliella straminimaris]MCO6046456.1 carbohydrate kinase family protein [Aeoliella straminimaris]
MEKTLDVIACGSCVVDVLVRPVALDVPIGGGQLVRTEPLRLTTGGIVSNAGITLARLGMRTAAFTYRGNDEWADVIQARYQAEGIDTSHLMAHPSAPTSTTAVLIDPAGERSFLHAVGAPKLLDKQVFLSQLDYFAQSRFMLLGYFSLLPNLHDDLPEVLAAIRAVGCMTALDAAGTGGTFDELSPVLPQVDVYVPSYKEASHQTGLSDPAEMIAKFRSAGAPGVVGVKLGAQGALVSDADGRLIEVPPVPPPGPVVDTTGAGDSFIGGLLCGLLREMPLAEAGRLAAACGARCVTALGATTAVGDFASTAALAGLNA